MLKIKAFLLSKLQAPWSTAFGKDAELKPPSYIKIGENVSFGARFVVQTNLEIGDNVLISSNVSCVGDDHAYDDPDKPINFGGRKNASTVIIEGDNLIGYGTTIVGNVRIGKGCIVGVGSIVSRDLPPYTCCIGIPARPFKRRFNSVPNSFSGAYA